MTKMDSSNDENFQLSPDLFSSDEICSENSKGFQFKELFPSNDPYFWEPPQITPSQNHSVMFHLPLIENQQPKPFKFSSEFCWHKDYVRIPFSKYNSYPGKNGETIKKWDLIQNALSKPIDNSWDLEECILSYNSKYAGVWKLHTLHAFFNEQLEKDESDYFFKKLAPKIIQLALRLPELLPSSTPLLKKSISKAISLTQLQIGCLMANAFFCTFPRRNATKPNSEFDLYPTINFVNLYKGYPEDIKFEKIRCIINYFRRITNKDPFGIVTFERRVIEKNSYDWTKSNELISNCKLHINNKGLIEKDGAGMLQVDFANKFIGGGVLNYGCVQEEIRFCLCPELIISKLFTEELNSNESLVIYGVEQYNHYKGYADTFKWVKDFQDETPKDKYFRRKCYLVAIDAIHFNRAQDQYESRFIFRELNKALAGFQMNELSSKPLPPVATGNWGCGAFRGDPYLKSLIQLIACTASKRHMAYFTFGNNKLMEDFWEMYEFLVSNKLTINELLKFIRFYGKNSTKNLNGGKELYEYIFKQTKDTDCCIQKSKMLIQSSISKFFQSPKQLNEINSSSVHVKKSSIFFSENIEQTNACGSSTLDSNTTIQTEQMENLLNEDLELFENDIVFESEPEESSLEEKSTKRFKK